MSRFKLSERSIGNIATIHVEDDFYGSAIEIAQIGATLLNFTVKTPHGFLNVVDGYRDEEEFSSAAGARSCIMAPFSNKIKNNRYEFQGKTYEFTDFPGQIIHGFVFDKKFEILDIKYEETYIQLSFGLDDLSQFWPEAYPFKVGLTVVYTFSGNSLKLAITGVNNGSEDAPFACGWHPYFSVSEKSIDTNILTIQAEKIVMTDAELFPYEKEMAYTHVSNLPGSDFRRVIYNKKRVLGRRQLNVCYSQLIKNKDGMIVTSIEPMETSAALHMKQPYGVLYCFTADELSARPRHSIALEPVEFITDAFNRSELADQLTLKPAESRCFPIELEYV